MVQIALLRGINVGKAKRVAMAELRSLFEELGYTDVKTLINSGNVVFSGPAVKSVLKTEEKLEAAFSERFGFSSRFVVLSAADLARIIDENPLGDVADHSRFLVSFLKTSTDRQHLLAIEKQDWQSEGFGLGTRCAYLWSPEGILASPLAAAVNKALGNAVTARNWATVLKLKALASAPVAK